MTDVEAIKETHSFDEMKGEGPMITSIDEQQMLIEQLAEEHGIDHAKLMRKVDLHILPAICMLYLLAFLDRVNISNANVSTAKVFGMSKEIGLTGTQYNTCLTIFFVPYVVCEVPSNILLKKFKPHVWLSLCMVMFGAVSIGQGFVHSYGALITTRFLLGLFETGMFPGCFYLLAMWYRREEGQKRYSFFFSSTCLAGAFGGLIAAGVSHLNGQHGLSGWRYLFIIEGSVTVGVSCLLFFFLSDFPEDSKFLTENERAFMKAKLQLDVGKSTFENDTKFKEVLGVFKEWKVWCAGFMYLGMIVPAYGYAYFANAIIAAFKYSPLQTQFHSIPPWVVAFALAMITAVFSDFYRHRYLFTLGCSSIAVVGFIILLSVHDNIHARYAACFLVASGLYSGMPLLICWASMNFAGHYRRGVGTGWMVGFGNIGGIIATYTYLSTDAPFYTKGLGVGLGFTALSMISALIYFIGIRYENRQKKLGQWDLAWMQKSPERRAILGDLSPYYYYNY